MCCISGVDERVRARIGCFFSGYWIVDGQQVLLLSSCIPRRWDSTRGKARLVELLRDAAHEHVDNKIAFAAA